MVSSDTEYKVSDDTAALQTRLRTRLGGERWDELLQLLADTKSDDTFWLLRAVTGVGLCGPMTFDMVNDYLEMLEQPTLSREALTRMVDDQLQELW